MFKLDMRLQGAAAALNMAQLLQALLLAAYTAHRDVRLRGKPEQTFRGWSREAVQGWGKYFKYAVPAAAMVGSAAGPPLVLLRTLLAACREPPLPPCRRRCLGWRADAWAQLAPAPPTCCCPCLTRLPRPAAPADVRRVVGEWLPRTQLRWIRPACALWEAAGCGTPGLRHAGATRCRAGPRCAPRCASALGAPPPPRRCTRWSSSSRACCPTRR
jgi:hypothetical protein